MDTMEKETTVRTQPPMRRRFALAASGVAVAALVVASIAVFGGNGTPDEVVAGNEPIVGGVPIAAAAMCVEFYDLDTLAGRDLAFDGTVASAAGDRVTFSVHNWFTGGSGDSVTLEAMGIAPGTITSAYHDENQVFCVPEIVEEVGQLMVDAIEKSAVDLNFNCPLTGEYKIGANWAETH